MDLTLRLGILRDAGQLSQENYNKVMEIIRYFHEEKGIKLVEENAAMFITHLTSTLKRLDENNLVDEMDKEIKETLKLQDKYEEAFKIAKDLEKVWGDVPEAELDFLLLHICSLIRNVNICN